MERYISKPHHLLWAVLFLLTGAISFPFQGSWALFGASMFVLGTVTWIWIVFSGMWHNYEMYWCEIKEVARVLNQTKDPNVWAAFGFVADRDSNFKVEVSDLDNSGHGTTYKFDLPGSETQFSTFADGTLMGRPMSETEWAGPAKLYSVPVFRKLKKELETRKLIRLKNVSSPTQGYAYTAKGKEIFLKHASEGIKLHLLDQRNLSAPSNIQPPLIQ